MPREWPTRSELDRINNRTKLVWGSHFSLGLLPKRICELTPEGQKPVVRSYRMQQRGQHKSKQSKTKRSLISLAQSHPVFTFSFLICVFCFQEISRQDDVIATSIKSTFISPYKIIIAYCKKTNKT